MQNNLSDKELQSLFNMLSDPFDPADIEWRIQGTPRQKGNRYTAMILPYITNRAVQKRLDDVFGPWGWKNEYMPVTVGNQINMLCGISVKVNDEWVTKWDGANPSDVESFKGAISDSMKRAAVEWGIGRYLYKLPKYWATVEKVTEKIYKIPPQSRPKFPAWALPSGYQYPSQYEPDEVEVDDGSEAVDGAQKTSNTTTDQDKAPAERQTVAELAGASTPTTTQAPAAPKKAEKAPAAVPTGNGHNLSPEELLERAKTYVIPEKLPGAGKTLGGLLDENAVLGMHLLKILTGTNPKVPAFEPKTSEEEKLVAAAKYVIDHIAQEEPSNN